jgi:aldehyde dehydrogenase (NAD+)
MTRTVTSRIADRAADGGETVETRNPADLDEVVATAQLADADAYVDACRTARAAQAAWAATPAPVRGQAIGRIGDLVTANKEALARLVTREIGKPHTESLGEVQEIIDTCELFRGEGRRLYGHTVPSEMPDKQLFAFREPVGVVTVTTAGNFPVAVPSWYAVPALLCGNAVVWKPAEYAPAISDALAQLFLAAGLPEGVLTMVLADGPTTFEGLERALGEGLVDKVGFTGSPEVGARIGELAGHHLQAPCLELGGKNPQVVLPDADLDLAVEGALFSGFGTAGQRCTSLGTVVCHEAIHDDFVSRFAAAVADAPVGDPTREVVYGPMMNRRFADRFEGWLDLIAAHHKVSGSSAVGRITAAQPREGFVGDPEAGLYYHPTIVDGVTADDALYRTETFGPLAGVARATDFDEAVELANGHGYGLSAAVYTHDPASAFRFRERVSAGMVSVNNTTSGQEAHLPFGGNGRSGNGGRLNGACWTR